jgi:hypothetical protein
MRDGGLNHADRIVTGIYADLRDSLAVMLFDVRVQIGM